MQYSDKSDDISEMEHLNKELYDLVESMDAQEAQYDDRGLIRLPQTSSCCDYQQAFALELTAVEENRIQRQNSHPKPLEVQSPPRPPICARHRALERQAKKTSLENFIKHTYRPYTSPQRVETFNPTRTYAGQSSNEEEERGVDPSQIMPSLFDEVSPRKKRKRAAPRQTAGPRRKKAT